MGLTIAMAQAMASFSIISLNEVRSDSLICFESLSNSFLNVLGRITAEATTGPARHPLPASSHPTSNSFF